MMTSDELRNLIELMGWSQGELAFHARRGRARTMKMARGALIDEGFARWLREVFAAKEMLEMLLEQGAPALEGTHEHAARRAALASGPSGAMAD